MKLLVSLIALVSITQSSFAAPKYPFPHNVTYKYGIMPKGIDATKVQKAYEDFMKLYEESPDGSMARIKFDDLAYTVSEGIGYGMICLVYIDNDQNKTQLKFNKLWKYYNNFLDPKGLMHWKINGFSGPTGTYDKNSATDGDIDVAIGLMQAYKQWGDESYLTDAKALIDKISKNDVTSDGYLNPGDSWGASPPKYNPSYFNTAALQVFKQASTFDWDKVISNSYSLTKKVQNATTGLVPAWCTKEGTHLTGVDDTYQYDATRVPWRMAWAYSWFGHQNAQDIATKITSWISTKTGNDPVKIVDGYKMDGNPTDNGEWNNSAFVGPFACGGMVDQKHQDWIDKCYSHLATLPEQDYYKLSLKAITLLFLSGNMPNFWDPVSTVKETVPTVNRTSDSDKIKITSAVQNGTTAISFSLENSSQMEVSMYSVSGKRVANVSERWFYAGNNTVPINRNLSTGTYLLKMKHDNEVTVQIILLK